MARSIYSNEDGARSRVFEKNGAMVARGAFSGKRCCHQNYGGRASEREIAVIPGWCVSTRPQMHNCASGNLEIPDRRFAPSGMTATLRIPAARTTPGLSVQSRPLNKEGAGNAGCDVHPQPRAQEKKHK